MNALEKLVQAACRLYPDDPSAPSVLLSWIEQRRKFYVSLVRYAERFGGGKYKVASFEHEELEGCLAELEKLLCT